MTPDPDGPAATPTATTRAVAYGLLWLAIPLALVVLCAMAATSAAATGGCGGG
jgi:hypothetical protein